MKFHKTELDGVWLIRLDPKEDERGHFFRTWCRGEFEAHGLNANISQCSLAHNQGIATLRGLHYQKTPHAETKVVFCLRGEIYDVVVDLRPSSKTFCKWMAFELSEDKPQLLYIPEGFAHGYQTLTPDTQVYYQMSTAYAPESAWGVRWDDPAFGIKWPEAERRMISDKDQQWPAFSRRQEESYASF
jgi:dTDP-4-dehydrorhamnose 3,5-epimerase